MTNTMFWHRRLTKGATALIMMLGLVGLAACSSSGDSGGAPSTSAVAEGSSQAGETPAEEDAVDDTEGTGGVTGENTQICAAYNEIEAIMQTDPGDDPAAALEQMSTIVAAMEAVTAPAEISADWSTITTMFTTLRDAVAAVVADPTVAGSAEQLVDEQGMLDDPGFEMANENIESWVTQNC